jgi:hypothetical protein
VIIIYAVYFYKIINLKILLEIDLFDGSILSKLHIGVVPTEIYVCSMTDCIILYFDEGILYCLQSKGSLLNLVNSISSLKSNKKSILNYSCCSNLQTKIALSYTSSDKLIGIELFIIYIYF